MKKRGKTTQNGQSSPQAEALARLKLLLSDEENAQLEAEMARPLFPAIRINPLKARPEQLADWAQRYGWELKPIPYCSSGWWLAAARVSPSHTLEHLLGQVYIQDAASMLPAELFDLEGLATPLILDMAASPGGKTTHLVSRTADHGLVIANDSSPDRIMALRLVLQTWGATSTAVTRYPGEKFGSWFPDTFDRVLLDAPCSMQNLRSTEAHPMRAISAKEQQNLAKRQARLLASALQAVKIGGQVVYSTCTLAPEEDEAVIDALLKAFPRKFEVENLGKHLPLAAPALASVGTHAFDPRVTQAARLWPHIYHTSGFFAALLRKSAAMDRTPLEPPLRPMQNRGLVQLSSPEMAALSDYLFGVYAFDLWKVLGELGLDLWKRESGMVYALPTLYFQHFEGFPFQALGLLAGEQTPQGFVPSHEWVSRFYRDFTGGRYTLSEEHVAGWLRGEDIQGSPGAESPSGSMVIVQDEQGRFLGRGKVQANRLKNLLPRRLA